MKKILLFRHPLSFVLLVCSVFLGSMFTVPTTTSAFFLEGGRSEEATYCSCSACWKIRVGSPKSGTFMYCYWYTRMYDHYNIWPNAWQLGKASAWMVCLQISYPYCEEDGGGYLLDLSGTSN